ncbi:MAG: ankyrin repeat domain-containing protein [Deltaproteobacteria bacterium]|nr:ankyrin repeat domain-containing protein [Deltaproteobacteria bacterium]
MFRCAKTFCFLAVLILLTSFLGCGPSSEDARQQLSRAGVPVSSDAVIKSIHNGDVRAVELLLDAGLDPNKPDSQGRIPLIEAAIKNRSAMVKILLDRNADPNIKPDHYGQTALMLAASLGRGEIVKTLLAHGAAPNLRDDANSQTALIMATIKGHTDIVKTLLAHGADRELRDHDGFTALDYARKLDHQGLIQVLEQARGK